MVITKINTKRYLYVLGVTRKMAAVSDKMDEAQVEEFSKCENRQQEKEIENSTGQKPQEDQEVMQQVCWLHTLATDKNKLKLKAAMCF